MRHHRQIHCHMPMGTHDTVVWTHECESLLDSLSQTLENTIPYCSYCILCVSVLILAMHVLTRGLQPRRWMLKTQRKCSSSLMKSFAEWRRRWTSSRRSCTRSTSTYPFIPSSSYSAEANMAFYVLGITFSAKASLKSTRA
jgi:hypothetical protein